MISLIHILLLSISFAQPDTMEIPYEKYELDNGLDVILAPDRSTPVVYVSVWYHVGSKDETAGLTGFAHLFEHLMFQGSLSHDDEYFGPLQEVGATINGTTSFDRTNYYEYLPSQHLPLALFMESDRMGYLLEVLTQDKLDNQRLVVRNERRQRYEDPPYGDAWGLLSENMFQSDHPYHHLPIGSHADLEAADLTAVKDFFKKWYAPSNASLLVAGDFDMETTKQRIEEYFGPIKGGEKVVRPTIEPAALKESKTLVRYDDVPERKVWLAWHTPALFQPGDAELDLFSSVIASGMDSRLYKALVRDQKVAKTVNAFQMSGHLGSRYLIMATATKEHTTEELVAAIDAELATVFDSAPPTSDEINAAKANFELRFYEGQATIQGKGETLQIYNMNQSDPGYVNKDLQRYLQATAETTLEAGKKYLSNPRFELHYLPESDRPEPTPETGGE